jgi:hypothetical protein
MPDAAALIDAAARLAADGALPTDGGPRLAEQAGGDRDALTAARDHFIGKLHARSDDFEATRALRLVHKAIEATPRTGIVIVEGRRARRT